MNHPNIKQAVFSDNIPHEIQISLVKEIRLALTLLSADVDIAERMKQSLVNHGSLLLEDKDSSFDSLSEQLNKHFPPNKIQAFTVNGIFRLPQDKSELEISENLDSLSITRVKDSDVSDLQSISIDSETFNTTSNLENNIYLNISCRSQDKEFNLNTLLYQVKNHLDLFFVNCASYHFEDELLAKKVEYLMNSVDSTIESLQIEYPSKIFEALLTPEIDSVSSFDNAI